jgi:polyhydroxyalkanoate synthase
MSGQSQGLSLLEKARSLGWVRDVNPLRREGECVAEAGSLKLIRYLPKKVTAKRPLLLIPSFINRYYVLDLLPEKSLIQYYLNSGFEVYLLNWGEPNDEDHLLSFETLFQVHLDYLFSELKARSRSSQFHIVGQCLGGQMGLLYSLLHPEDVRSLSLITTPVDFDFGGKLTEWARHPGLRLSEFVEARGNAPWFWMQMGFLGMKPTQLIAKYKKLFSRRKDARFLRSFWALETWSFDNISVRGRLFLTLIQEFYQNNSWLNEGLSLGERKLKLVDLCVPVSVLNAEDDHIVPLDSTLLKDHVPRAPDFKKWQSRGGHIGALLSGPSQQTIWPQMIKWMKQHE